MFYVNMCGQFGYKARVPDGIGEGGSPVKTETAVLSAMLIYHSVEMIETCLGPSEGQCLVIL